MNELIIYHGSDKIIKEPLFGKGKDYNDYGKGFYCTESSEIAKEWGCSLGADGFANCYSLDLDGLNILNLTSQEYGILNWLAILLDNRLVRLSSPIEKRGREYLLNNYLLDYKQYDVIRGYRADDSYFSFARAFLSNSISLSQLEYAMNLGKLGEQVVIISKKAFSALQFMDYDIADNKLYYARKMKRDNIARLAYQRELEKEDVEGVYIRDIIRGGDNK